MYKICNSCNNNDLNHAHFFIKLKYLIQIKICVYNKICFFVFNKFHIN